MTGSVLSLENRSGKITLIALGFILCVFVARIQEIFAFLSAFYLGKLAVALGIILCISAGKLQELLGLKETKLFAALWLLGIITIPFSVWPGAALNFWALSITSLILFYLVTASYSASLDDCIFLIKGLAFCGLLLCIEIIFLRPRATGGRPLITSGTLDPNDLALTLVYLLPFVFTLFQTGGKFQRAWTASLIVLFFSAMFITQSRGGAIGLFFVVLASMFVHGSRLRTKILIVGLALISLLFLPHHFVVRFDKVWKGTDYNYSVGRILIWKEGAGLFLSHILTGVGAGQSAIAMGQTYGHAHWRAMHDIYIQVGLELGLPGLLLFIAILHSIWKNIQTGLSACSGQDTTLRVVLINSRLSLLGYMVCGVFLSEAYSPILPFLLALTKSLAVIAKRMDSKQKAFGGIGHKEPNWTKRPIYAQASSLCIRQKNSQ